MADHNFPMDFTVLDEIQKQLARVVTAMESRLRQAGLTPAQYQLLLAVKAHGDHEPPTLGTLATQMQIGRPSLVEPLDALVGRGFLDKRRDGADHRRVLVTLTPAGDQWLQPLAEDLLRDLSKNGVLLLRALRAVLVQSGAVRAQPQPAANGSAAPAAWRMQDRATG